MNNKSTSKAAVQFLVFGILLLIISCNPNKNAFKDHAITSADGYGEDSLREGSNNLLSDESYAPGVELEKGPLRVVKATASKELWIPRSLFISGLKVSWSQDKSKVIVKGRALWNQSQYQSSGDVTFSLVGLWQPEAGISDLVLVKNESQGLKNGEEIKGRVYCVSVGAEGDCTSTITEIFVRVKGLYIFSGQAEFWNGQFAQDEPDHHELLDTGSQNSNSNKKEKNKNKKNRTKKNKKTFETPQNEVDSSRSENGLRDEVKGSDKGLEVTGGTNENNIDELFKHPDVDSIQDELVQPPPPVLPAPPDSPTQKGPATNPLVPQRDEELDSILRDHNVTGTSAPEVDPSDEVNSQFSGGGKIPLPRHKPTAPPLPDTKPTPGDSDSKGESSIPIPKHKPKFPSEPERPQPQPPSQGQNPPPGDDGTSIPDQGNDEKNQRRDKNGDVLRGGKLIGYYKPFQSVGIPSQGQLQNPTSLVDVVSNIAQAGLTEKFPLRSVRNKDGNYYGNYATMEFLVRASFWLNRLKPGFPLEVNDISSQRGGRLRPHVSHQNGLDMDVGFFFKNLRENYYGRTTLTKGGLDPNFDRTLQWNFFKSIMKYYNDKIFMIFVHPRVKKAMCEEAYKSGDLSASSVKSNTLTIAQETLRRLVPESGHYDHFHTRLRCPKEKPYINKKGIQIKSRCVDTARDLPAITGCANL